MAAVDVLPVKNTFIHFNLSNTDGMSSSKNCGRSLRLCQTDPDESTLYGASRQWQSSTGGTAEVEVDAEPALDTRSMATQTQDQVENLAEDEVQQKAVAGLSGCLSEFALQLETASCSGDESTNICTPEHSPRFGRSPWSTPCTSPDCWSASTPGCCSFSAGTPNPGISVIDELAKRPLIATSIPSAMPSVVPSSGSMLASGFFDGGFTFTFTLRLADNHGLGIDVMEPVSCEWLVVQQVLQEGAIEAWNKQCLDGSMACLKVVQYGDAIVSVNGRTNRQGMMQECREKMLLKLTVVRRFPDYIPSLNTATALFPWPGLESFRVGHARLAGELHTCSRGEGERFHASKLPVVM